LPSRRPSPALDCIQHMLHIMISVQVRLDTGPTTVGDADRCVANHYPLPRTYVLGIVGRNGHIRKKNKGDAELMAELGAQLTSTPGNNWHIWVSDGHSTDSSNSATTLWAWPASARRARGRCASDDHFQITFVLDFVLNNKLFVTPDGRRVTVQQTVYFVQDSFVYHPCARCRRRNVPAQ
jgi:hypothetical protein